MQQNERLARLGGMQSTAGDIQLSGDGDFTAFVRRHGRSLFGTAYLLTGDGPRAEELVQDTLAHLYPRWERVRSAEAPLAYVRRSLANRFVSDTRRPASRRVFLIEDPEPPSTPDIADAVTDHSLVLAMLRELPERQRAALVLRYFHDLSDDDIAAALDCRLGTVRSLLSRGLAALRAGATIEITTKGGAS